ncbi:ABC transporter substrate-binding protein [Halomonas caseinilytica]|uniref:ABC transporter substrate-binding protein n=1 Tax=Halomonas caseinilytica TaxID=438744 RepID=UPI00084871E7|nr:ABC transporter substrate-binding protein [Halomonas caseinilytica]
MTGSGWTLPAAALLVSTLPLAAQADSTAADEGPSLVSFDWGAADTLEALGLESHLVGLPHQAAPGYMAHLLEGRADVGGLKSPDLNAIEALSPGLILITGRQSAVQEDLQAVAETRDVTLAEGDYLEALSDKVKGLAALYGAEVQAEERLEALHADIESARESLTNAVDAVVVTHNDGHYSLRQEPVVSELLQIDQPAVPESVEPVSHGSRTFYPVTPDVLAEMSPDVVFVVDRSAAIGETPLEASTLQEGLARAGAEATRVEVLSPGLWYLSGDGLQSVRAQMDEITQALTP